MSKSEFSAVAIVAIHNGVYYFDRLCKHLRDNNLLLAVIDNGSQDNLKALVQQNQDLICSYTRLDYDGSFDLTKILQAKENLAMTLDANWIIHMDIDELIFSDIAGETFSNALHRVDSAGFDAVNFDEFVFLPINYFQDYSINNFHRMQWYYFFEPHQNRLVRAFKKGHKTKIASGGHNVEGPARVYPANMALRHYMFENKAHVKRKYRDRIYALENISRGFHGNRVMLQNAELSLPSRRLLKRLKKNQWCLDTSLPYKKHFWQWAKKT